MALSHKLGWAGLAIGMGGVGMTVFLGYANSSWLPEKLRPFIALGGLFLAVVGFIGAFTLFASAWFRRFRFRWPIYRTAAEAAVVNPALRVEVPEQPRAENLSRDRDGRRMVTFPRVTVRNAGRQAIEFRFWLFVPGVNGWDPAYLPVFESSELWERDHGRSILGAVRLAPGDEISGQVRFRVPFSEPSEKEMFFRLLMVAPSAEQKVDEWTVPLTLKPYLEPRAGQQATPPPESS